MPPRIRPVLYGALPFELLRMRLGLPIRTGKTKRDCPRIAMPLQRLKRTFAELGAFEASLYLFANLLARISRGRCRLIRYYIVAQPVASAPAHALRPSPSNPVRLIGREDAAVAQFPRPKTVLARRFDDGGLCFVAESKGRFAGFLWISHRQYEEDEVRCRFDLHPPERCVWDYDVYVEPDFRVGRTFARLWDAANAYLTAHGVRWSLSRISAFNPVSLAAHQRLGIRKLASATFIVTGRVQLSLFTTPPFVHLGWNDDMRPQLPVRAPSDD